MVVIVATKGRARNLLSFQYTSSVLHLLPFTLAILLHKEKPNVHTYDEFYIFHEGTAQHHPFSIELFFTDTIYVKHLPLEDYIHIDGTTIQTKMDVYCAIPL